MNDRQRLEAIVAVVCRYLPPDGISREEAMSQIIGLVDPLPAQPEHPLDIADRAYFAGKQDGIDEALAQHEKKWVGLTDKDFKYQQPAEILTMKYTEAILKEKNI